MIDRIIEASVRNRIFVLLLAAMAALAETPRPIADAAANLINLVFVVNWRIAIPLAGVLPLHPG